MKTVAPSRANGRADARPNPSQRSPWAGWPVLRLKTPRMKQRYAHLSPDYTAGAVGKMDGTIGGMLPKMLPGEAQLATTASPRISPEYGVPRKSAELIGVPNGIRTRVTAVKGRCPNH